MALEKEMRPATDQRSMGANGIGAVFDCSTDWPGLKADDMAKMTAACAGIVVSFVLAVQAFGWVIGTLKGWW